MHFQEGNIWLIIEILRIKKHSYNITVFMTYHCRPANTMIPLAGQLGWPVEEKTGFEHTSQ